MAETPVGPGTLLAGRFVLEDLLDETEGARFWRATDRTLARNVAVHVIAADDPRSAALLNAARTSATVTDGHLLRVLDAATEDGVTYVVNEWGHGSSLDRLLAEGPLSPRRAAWVAKEVAEAISTAHRHGIAHGRLLPENVLITEAGSVKLIGFVVDAVLRGRHQHLTGGGRPLGEHEADVVNLAALLYAGLTARWPGTEGCTLPPAPTEHGRLLRPRQVRAGVPRPLDMICERVLNGGGGAAGTGLETAHEIYAAICDFVGDPSAAAPVDLERTAFFDRDELATLERDPEATQAALPRTEDDDETGGPGTRHTGTRPTEARPAPPPPVLPPVPERPLFASAHPRPVSEALPTRSTGPGSAPPPSGWGPDAEPADPGRPWGEEPPGRSWLRLALVLGVLLVLVVAVVVAFNLGQGSGDPDPGSEETKPAQQSDQPAPVRIVGVSDYDPQGDPPEENPESAPLAVDGDPATAWRTSEYYDPLELLKDGVGLSLDLGEPTEVSSVKVSFLGSPTSFEVLATGEGVGAPGDPAALTRVGGEDAAGTEAEVVLEDPVTTQHLVVWLTSLPPVGGSFRGQVAEIVVR